jgi:putative ABC transport system ATP-binding protein
LCDEPTGNIDSVMTASILDLFSELNQGGLTIVTITHDTDVADRASRQVRIIDGVLNEEQK